MSQQISLSGAPVVRYYRTMLYLVFRTTKAPKDKTPDPIFGIRVTVVSDTRGKYNIKRFKPVVYHTSMLLAPKTFWKDLVDRHILEEVEIAAEIDEEIDKDELEKSVPVFKKLNYAERVAVFFSSKRKDKWRQKEPDWWQKKLLPEIIHEGIGYPFDYVYNEMRIKSDEDVAFKKRRVRSRFDNEKGELV